MTRVRFWIVLAGVLVCAPSAHAAKRMNFLLVTADDLNADSMGWMGSKMNATPALDAFAKKSIRLEQLHTVAPICQPSRSAMLTGRFPHRNGAMGFIPIRGDVPTLMEVLGQAGYFNAIINKVSHSAPKREGTSPWHLRVPEGGHNPQELAQAVATAIAAARSAGKPFFINANITDPHRPFIGAKESTEDPSVPPFEPPDVAIPSALEDVPGVRTEVARYFTSVRRMDRSFEKILSALKDSGQLKSTLVVFFSDHGISAPFAKATVYRAGTWTPALFQWPGMPAARANPALVENVNLMPTFLEILGVPSPKGMDGKSLVPLLRGGAVERDFAITQVDSVRSKENSFVQRCVRTKRFAYMWHGWADGKTKFKVEAMSGLSFSALAEAAAADPAIKSRVDQYQRGEPEMLFDLEADPDERANLAKEPRHRAVLEKLRATLLAHMKRTEDPELAAFAKIATKK